MSFVQDHIYPKLPVPFQNAAISAFGLQWYYRRFGGIFKESYKGFREREAFSFQQWRDYQTEQMRKLLLHAHTTVPYYKQTLKQAGFTETTLAKFELEQLTQIPVLEKDTLR